MCNEYMNILWFLTVMDIGQPKIFGLTVFNFACQGNSISSVKIA